MIQQNIVDNILTNEEGRVSFYKEAASPTVSHTVNSLTPLDEINLNWTEKDLRERERTKHVHRLHPYLGKYIPQLVEIFLRKYFKKGQTVLDPFCGSGTTLVQANELGINSVGFDISEFNIMLCQVKTAKYDINLLKKEAADLIGRVKNASNGGGGQTLFSNFGSYENIAKTDNEYLNTWFAELALKELLLFKHFLEDYTYRDFFKIVLSRSARSARLTTHFDLDFPKKPQLEPYHCYKHGRMCQPTLEALKFLERYTLDSVKRIEEFSKLRTSATVETYHVDSRFGESGEIDGIITSPPYVGLIDYHDQHKYAYNLLGLTDRSDNEIGPAKRGSSIKAKENYKIAMSEVFRHTGEKVRPGGKIIVVAGDRNNLYPDIAEMAGLRLVEKLDRHVNRRTGRRSSEFYETIFIYEKQ